MTPLLARLTFVATALLATAAAPAPHYAVAGAIAGPDGGSWDYASVDPAHGRLFVARAASVTIVDLATRAARTIGTVARGHAVVPIADGGMLLVTSGQDDSVRLLDPESGREVARIAVGGKPDAAFYDAARHRAVVMNAKSGTVSVIDVAAHRVERTIALNPGLEFAQGGPGDTLFVNNEDRGEIETANLASGTVGAPIALPGCEAPSGLAYDARSHLLVSACANGKAAVVDAVTRRVVALLAIGRGPDAVILDSARQLAFIPCGESGTLAIVTLAGKPTVAATVRTEPGARTGAIDPRDGTLYLPTAKLTPPATPGGRPGAAPGTFHIVVVRPVA